MSVYPSQSGGGIGALLRLIQEERSSSLAGLPPQTEPSSPLRGTIQEPLQSPEAQGTTRVVSLRPEGVTAQQGPSVEPNVVAPIAPIPTPVPTPTPPMAQGPSPVNQPSYTAGSSMPSIGTRLVSSMVSKVLGATAKPSPVYGPTKPSYMPTPSRMGPQMVQPAPTPTPAQSEVQKYKQGMPGIPKKAGGFYTPTGWGRA